MSSFAGRSLAIIPFILLTLFNAPFSFAAERVVDLGGSGDFTSIQDCIDASADGDTCLVMPGTYVENIDLGSKNLTISSESGPDVTVIDGGAAGSVVTIADGQGETCVIDGLTITNGDNTTRGGGISIDATSPTISNCIIDNNDATYGGGIYMRNGASPRITGNTISNNSATSHSGGIACNKSTPTIDGNLILSNHAPRGGGMRNYNDGSNATIINNIIAGNSAADEGGALHIMASATITNNTIVGNSAPFHGGGINIDIMNGTVHVNNNIIVDSPDGTGVSCTNPVDSFDHNNVWNNADGDYWGSCTPGPSDISEDPRFVNPGSGDYHLEPDSPCIDAGDSAAPGIPDTDYDGDDRIIGAAADIGADEYNPILVSGDVDASSGGTGRPSWDFILKRYEDIIYITNTSSGPIPLPFYTILTELEPESVTALDTDGGGDRPPTAYWAWSNGDGLLDPGETVSRLWQFSDPDEVPFTFHVDVMTCYYDRMEGDSERLASFRYETARGTIREPAVLTGDLRFIPDDGSAEIYGGADGRGVVLTNAFTLDRAVELREVSFLSGGVGEGDPVDVIIYFDPSGTTSLPAPEIEIHRHTVDLEGGGFQTVELDGLPLVPGPGGSARFYVGVKGRSERSFSMGIDLSVPGSGASVSLDGGLTFDSLSDHPLADGVVMIRAEVAEWTGPWGCESGGAASRSRSAPDGRAWRLLILAVALCLTALCRTVLLRGGN